MTTKNRNTRTAVYRDMKLICMNDIKCYIAQVELIQTGLSKNQGPTYECPICGTRYYIDKDVMTREDKREKWKIRGNKKIKED